jgi:hypothetical protein
MAIPDDLMIRIMRRKDGTLRATQWLRCSGDEGEELTTVQMLQIGVALLRGVGGAPAGWAPPAPKESRKKARPDHVYLLSDGMYHKIGISQDPSARAMEISREIDHLVHLLHSFPCSDARGAEIRLHAGLAKQHVRGEWFSLKGQQIERIRQICGYEGGSFIMASGEVLTMEGLAE